MKQRQFWAFSLISFTIWSLAQGGAVIADSISPGIRDDGQSYSNEEANSSYYGDGEAGRLSEASELRFQGDKSIHNGKLDLAMRQLAKAVQLEPGDPQGHLLYARAISAKIYRSDSAPSLVLVNKGIDEWKLIWRHDADSFDQSEARKEAKKLVHLSKVLLKQGIQENNGSASHMVAATAKGTIEQQ
jgi:hypothetical protein